MGNWYENIQKGQDDQQDRYNALADRQRAAELAAQADEDRIALNAYTKDLRDLKIAEMKRLDEEAKVKAEQEKQERILAKKLTIPDMPFVTDGTPVVQEGDATDAEYQAVPEYQLTGAADNEAYEAEQTKIKADMAEKLSNLQTKYKNAKPEERKAIEATIKELEAQKELVDQPVTRGSVAEQIEEAKRIMSMHAANSPLHKQAKAQLERLTSEAGIVEELAIVEAGLALKVAKPNSIHNKRRLKDLNARKKELEGMLTTTSDLPDKAVALSDIEDSLKINRELLIEFDKANKGYEWEKDKGYLEEFDAHKLELEAALEKAAEAKAAGDEERFKKIVAQEIISNPMYKYLNPEAMGRDITDYLTIRDEYVQKFESYRDAGNLEKAELYQAALKEVDLGLWKEMNEQGLFDISSITLDEDGNMVGGSPEVLEATMSEFLGHEIRLQKRSDGNWHIFSDGELLLNSEGKNTAYWTQKELGVLARREVDPAYEAALVAYNAKLANLAAEGAVTPSENLTALTSLIEKAMEVQGKIDEKMLENNGVKFSTPNPETNETMFYKDGQFWIWNPVPDVIDGVSEKEVRLLDAEGMFAYSQTVGASGQAGIEAFLAIVYPGYKAGLKTP